MTALAAICGMLPLAFALGAGSQMLQPLAIAVIGGLTISMVLSLVITPLVYFLLTRNREPMFRTFPGTRRQIFERSCQRLCTGPPILIRAIPNWRG